MSPRARKSLAERRCPDPKPLVKSTIYYIVNANDPNPLFMP
jgi:hypothetical protein